MKFLIADDSLVMRRIIRKGIELAFPTAAFYEVETGFEAVDAVEAEQPDLILLDWNMPDLLGIEALQKIREHGHQVPILMVTTECEASRISTALDRGANGYLKKPFTLEALAEKVMGLLDTVNA